MGRGAWWFIRVESGDVRLACDFRQSLGAFSQDVRRVGFGDQKRCDNPYDASKYRHEAVKPSPTLRLSQKATRNWTWALSVKVKVLEE